MIGDPGAGHGDDVAELTHEHEGIVSGLTESRSAFARLRSSASAEDAAAAASALNRLREAAQTHFAHEESDLRTLCEAAEPQALAAEFKNMGREASPAEAAWFMQWISEDLPRDDAAALGKIIPAPVRLIARLVAGRRYARVQRAACS